jgi:hypothetical protein
VSGLHPPRVFPCSKYGRHLLACNSIRYEGRLGRPRYGTRRAGDGGVPWPHAGNVNAFVCVSGLDTLLTRANGKYILVISGSSSRPGGSAVPFIGIKSNGIRSLYGSIGTDGHLRSTIVILLLLAIPRA